MIQKTELFPGITLTCCPDHRFKQGLLSMQVIRPMCREEAAYNALWPAVLLRGTAPHPDLRSITLHLDDLYGAEFSTSVRRIGDYQTAGVTCGFIEDRFLPEGESVLAPVVDFLGELLFRPALRLGAFRRDYVESEKQNLTDAIEGQKNDKRLYSSLRLMQVMCKNDSFGIPRLGEKELVAAVTTRKLYRHFQKILRESRIDLFYVGSAPEQASALLKRAFSDLRRDYRPLPPQTAFSAGEFCREEEVMDVAQGKLAMGFTSPITLRAEEFAAMQVCNTVLGAGMNSKFFMEIREKNSLCYDIGSVYHGSKGIFSVFAGIDCDKADQVQSQILEQIALCQKGEISDSELTGAKQALLSTLRGVHDSPGAMENYYATAALSGMTMDPAAYMQAVEQVTKADVAAAAATLALNCVYFLKGVRP